METAPALDRAEAVYAAGTLGVTGGAIETLCIATCSRIDKHPEYHFSRRTPLNFLAAFLPFAGFLTAMNSPPFLLRLVKAVTPPSLVFSCERFLTAPLRALSAYRLVDRHRTVPQCVLVSCHFSRSGGGPPGFCSFSTGPFQGLSVCLVFFQSVCWRGSSVGFSRLIVHRPPSGQTRAFRHRRAERRRPEWRLPALSRR
jgi:hypothetical protein